MHSIELTSVNLPELPKIGRWFRTWFEVLGAATAGLLVFIWRDDIVAQFANETWNLGAYYSAIFDWSSIQAAFLFGVYAFFLSRSEPFIQAIAGSGAFKLLRRYVVRTLYLSMSLTVAALPMVVSPLQMGADWVSLGFAIAWFQTTLLVYTFLCFVKVIRVFGKIERRS
jgi:hypothetical protein